MMRVLDAQLIPRPPTTKPTIETSSGMGLIQYWFAEMVIRHPSLRNAFGGTPQWVVGKLTTNEEGKLVYNGAVVENEEVQRAFTDYVDRILLGKE